MYKGNKPFFPFTQNLGINIHGICERSINKLLFLINDTL